MSDNHKVLTGLDGWLFLNNDTNRVLDQITGKYAFPSEFWQNWRDVFKIRSENLKNLGAKYIYAVAPNKESVYRRYLPPELKIASVQPVDVVRSASAGLVDFEFPLEEMLVKSHKANIYSKGDTHWNGRGGYLFYARTMARLGLPGIDPALIKFISERKDGDLSSKIGTKDQTWRISLKRTSFKMVDNNHVVNIGSKSTFENSQKSLPSAVIFRDSFCSNIVPLYASSFSRVTFVWQPNIDYGLLQSEMPDIVISQQAERFLVSCPDETNGRSNSEWVAWKQSLKQ